MTTVLITAPYLLPHIDRFKKVFEQFDLELILPEVNERFEEEDILVYAGKFDGTICGDDRYSRSVIEKCLPRLKVISKWGTGIDSIDQKAAADLSVKVCNTPNAFTIPVSESVIGYMLSFARRLPFLDDEMKSGKWSKVIGKTLSECTLGVVGVGNVGKAVIRRAKAFGMEILGNDIIEIEPDFLLENNLEMTDLKDLIGRADFISINCTLNPTSYHLINGNSLLNVKPDAVLINTARGPIVDEHALIKALQEERLAGAALDVYEDEPLPFDSPLLKMNNVMLAPHNSNSSPFFWERVHWNTISNLLKALNLFDGDIQALKSLS